MDDPDIVYSSLVKTPTRSVFILRATAASIVAASFAARVRAPAMTAANYTLPLPLSGKKKQRSMKYRRSSIDNNSTSAVDGTAVLRSKDPYGHGSWRVYVTATVCRTCCMYHTRAYNTRCTHTSRRACTLQQLEASSTARRKAILVASRKRTVKRTARTDRHAQMHRFARACSLACARTAWTIISF